MYKNQLKELREDKELLQKDMANILNISISNYTHYENEDDIIPLKHLITLCDYLNVSLDYIFELTNTQRYNISIKGIDITKAGNNLKGIRKELGLSQSKLALELGTADTTISAYEKGKHLISTAYLYTICKNYKVSADYLLGKIDTPKYLK